jgi:hypothetical protein
MSSQLHSEALKPRGKSRRYQLDRRMRGPQNRSGLLGEESILSCTPSAMASSSFNEVDRYTFIRNLLVSVLNVLPVFTRRYLRRTIDCATCDVLYVGSRSRAAVVTDGLCRKWGEVTPVQDLALGGGRPFRLQQVYGQVGEGFEAPGKVSAVTSMNNAP